MNEHSPSRGGSEFGVADAAIGHVLVVLGQPDPDKMGFELSSARLSLGAGENDDIYLPDVGIVPGHVEMIFLDGRMTVLSASAAIWVNGQRIDQFPFEWPALSVMSFGPATHLAYGPRGSEWAEPPAMEGVFTAEEELAADAGASTEAAADVTLAGHPDFHVPLLTSRERVIHSARLGAWALAAATVIVVVLVLADVLWGTREVIYPSETAIDHASVALHKLIDSDPDNYRSVKVTQRPDGVLALTGFIESEEAFRNLAERARQEDVNSRGNVRLDTLTSRRLLALVNDQLAGQPLYPRLDVSADEVRLTVVGIAGQPDQSTSMRDILSRLAPRVAPRELKIEMHLEQAEKIAGDIERELSLGITTRELGVKVGDDGVHISGLVAASVENETRRDLEAIRKNFKARVPLSIDLEVEEKVNFNLVSLSQGGKAPLATMVQHGNHTTFLQGDAVYGVAKLLEVRADGVSLALGRRQIFLPLII